MASRDRRIDAHIARAAEFARPILTHLRELIHAGCPEVEETMKWGFPHFMHHGMLCRMAAFKTHCSFGFWNAALVLGTDQVRREAMGQFGRLTSRADLPPRRRLIALVKKAARLNEAGERPARRKPSPKKRVVVPAELRAALARNAAARSTFDAFSPSHKREYAEWIAEAKRADTRSRRVATAIEWMAEGKPHNSRYMKR